jgi:hypothetical protein
MWACAEVGVGTAVMAAGAVSQRAHRLPLFDLAVTVTAAPIERCESMTYRGVAQLKRSRKMAASSEPRYRVSNSNSAWHPPQTVMPDRLQIQFL